jgi:hypothetical protein
MGRRFVVPRVLDIVLPWLVRVVVMAVVFILVDGILTIRHKPVCKIVKAGLERGVIAMNVRVGKTRTARRWTVVIRLK